jgi:hypothetical protein
VTVTRRRLYIRERWNLRKEIDQKRDGKRKDFLFKTPPIASHLHYAYQSFSFRVIKVS